VAVVEEAPIVTKWLRSLEKKCLGAIPFSCQPEGAKMDYASLPMGGRRVGWKNHGRILKPQLFLSEEALFFNWSYHDRFPFFHKRRVDDFTP
jgi:hypothetical protein